MPDSDSGVASGVPMDVTQSLGSQSPGQIPGQIAPGGTPGRGTNDADNSFSHNGSKQLMVKYGELIILGYNGQLPQGIFLFSLLKCLTESFNFTFISSFIFKVPFIYLLLDR